MAETVKIILDSTDELYSIPEIAKKMKTTKGFIYQLLDAGLLPSIRVGGIAGSVNSGSTNSWRNTKART